ALAAGRLEPEAWRALWALGLPVLLLSISGRVSGMTDNIITAGILGADMVTSLVLTQKLATLALGVTQSVGAASWAGLAELYARGQRDTFNRRLVELTRLVAILGVAALGPIVAYNRRFFDLWIRGRAAYGGDAVIAVAASNAFALGLLALWGWCFAGTGQQRRLVVPMVVGASVNLAASILLTRWLGLVGPLLGTSVSLVAVNLWC